MVVTIKNPITVVQQGGGPAPGPLDPEQVYRDTRPADWLVMPTPQENEAYFLLQVGAAAVDNVPLTIPWGVSASGGTTTLQFGTTDASGVFTPDPALTVTSAASSGTFSLAVPVASFSSPTTEGARQIIGKITSTENIVGIFSSDTSSTRPTRRLIIELSVKGSYINSLFVGASLSGEAMYNLKYCYVDTPNNSLPARSFCGCTALIAVRKRTLATNSTDFSSMFFDCYSLTAVPQLDTSNGTNFQNMFQNCYALTAIPQLNTSSGTNFQSMFTNCYSLTAVPQLDTRSGTNFQSMFNGCRSLVAAPRFALSGNFTFASMFYNCVSLRSTDLSTYDFSSASIPGSYFITPLANVTVDFTSLPLPGGTNTFLSGANGTQSYPVKVRILKDDAMLAITLNATSLFSGNYCYVYVPDALLAAYQADTYWSTLGTRLKAMSEWSA